jgi:hypothetical protein
VTVLIVVIVALTRVVVWARVVAAVRTSMHCPEPISHGVSAAHWPVRDDWHKRGESNLVSRDEKTRA